MKRKLTRWEIKQALILGRDRYAPQAIADFLGATYGQICYLFRREGLSVRRERGIIHRQLKVRYK